MGAQIFGKPETGKNEKLNYYQIRLGEILGIYKTIFKEIRLEGYINNVYDVMLNCVT